NSSSSAPTVAGTYTVVASFTSTDSNYTNGQSQVTSFSINKAHLTVTADNQSRLYGQVNPSFTAIITGFVNGDNTTSAGVTGTPTLTTTATPSSTVSGSPYAITVDVSGMQAANYDFTSASGNFTINKASTVTTLVSNFNPSSVGEQVTFT